MAEPEVDWLAPKIYFLLNLELSKVGSPQNILQNHHNENLAQQYNMKKTTFMMTVLMIIPLIKPQQCVQQCLQMLFHGCTVCYSTCNHETIQFEQCSYTYCAQQVYYQDGSDCIRYQTEYYTEYDCLPKCCHEQDIDGYIFNLQNVNKCKEGNDRSFGALIGGIFGGLGLIILIVFCIVCSSKSCWSSFCEKLCDLVTCRPCRMRIKKAYNDHKNKNRNQQRNSQANLGQSKEWKNDDSLESQQILNSYTNCTICLSMNNDCITKCGHSFHANCLDEWFQKKRSCPNCISSQMNPIKVYCKCCLKRYIDYDLSGSTRYRQFIELIKGPNCSMCQ